MIAPELEVDVAQLIVRNLEDGLVQELKLRAARSGRSAEAEHRAILEAALRPTRSGRSMMETLLAMPDLGEDEDFARIQGDFRLGEP